MIPLLKQQYSEQIVPELKKKYGHKNVHQVGGIQKVVINSGVSASLEKGAADEVAQAITAITGQKPVITRAKKSVANFKLRQGMPVGVKVTLRGAQMYHFLNKLIAVALPAIRDFRGIPSKMDGRGNYTLGITDHTIFPEISIDSSKRTIGMDITFVTSANTDEEAHDLLQMMGMPFRKKN